MRPVAIVSLDSTDTEHTVHYGTFYRTAWYIQMVGGPFCCLISHSHPCCTSQPATVTTLKSPWLTSKPLPSSRPAGQRGGWLRLQVPLGPAPLLLIQARTAGELTHGTCSFGCGFHYVHAHFIGQSRVQGRAPRNDRSQHVRAYGDPGADRKEGKAVNQ